MPSAGFEPAIQAGERLQTHALDRSFAYWLAYCDRHWYNYLFKNITFEKTVVLISTFVATSNHVVLVGVYVQNTFYI
jgi:hypothetical protein